MTAQRFPILHKLPRSADNFARPQENCKVQGRSSLERWRFARPWVGKRLVREFSVFSRADEMFASLGTWHFSCSRWCTTQNTA